MFVNTHLTSNHWWTDVQDDYVLSPRNSNQRPQNSIVVACAITMLVVLFSLLGLGSCVPFLGIGSSLFISGSDQDQDPPVACLLVYGTCYQGRWAKIKQVSLYEARITGGPIALQANHMPLSRGWDMPSPHLGSSGAWSSYSKIASNLSSKVPQPSAFFGWWDLVRCVGRVDRPMSSTWRGDDRNQKLDKNLNNIFFNQIDGSSGEVIGQEDCLMMNIYSPNLTPETPLPVMVWKKPKKSFNFRFCIARSGSMVGVLLLEAILPLSMEHPPI